MRLSLKLFVILCATASVLSLEGCGYVSKGLSSESDLIDRAALSIGVGRRDIKLIPGSIQGGMESVTYRIQESNGAMYTCQYTTMMVTSGEAICQKTSEGTPRLPPQQPPAQSMGVPPNRYEGSGYPATTGNTGTGQTYEGQQQNMDENF